MREMTAEEMMKELKESDYELVALMIKRLRSASITEHNLMFPYQRNWPRPDARGGA